MRGVFLLSRWIFSSRIFNIIFTYLVNAIFSTRRVDRCCMSRSRTRDWTRLGSAVTLTGHHSLPFKLYPFPMSKLITSSSHGTGHTCLVFSKDGLYVYDLQSTAGVVTLTICFSKTRLHRWTRLHRTDMEDQRRCRTGTFNSHWGRRCYNECGGCGV